MEYKKAIKSADLQELLESLRRNVEELQDRKQKACSLRVRAERRRLDAERERDKYKAEYDSLYASMLHNEKYRLTMKDVRIKQGILTVLKYSLALAIVFGGLVLAYVLSADAVVKTVEAQEQQQLSTVYGGENE